MKRSFVTATCLATVYQLCAPAAAQLIWDGDAANPIGKEKIFGNAVSECPAPSSITVVNDTARGKVWLFHKNAGEPRCEARNIRTGANHTLYRFEKDKTYFIGWSFKLNDTLSNHHPFQWKSYETGHQQNYPFLMNAKDGHLRLFYYGTPDDTSGVIWNRPIEPLKWHCVVLAIHTSNQSSNGWAELWFDDAAQTFSNGQQRFSGRTWDGSNIGANEPKWGVYNKHQPGIMEDVKNYISGLKIGTTYDDVKQSCN